jgi:hypothetical protein
MRVDLHTTIELLPLLLVIDVVEDVGLDHGRVDISAREVK